MAKKTKTNEASPQDTQDTTPTAKAPKANGKAKNTPKAADAPKKEKPKTPYGHRVGTTAEIMDNFVIQTLEAAKAAGTPPQVSVKAMAEATTYNTGKLRVHLRYLLKKVPGLQYEIIA